MDFFMDYIFPWLMAGLLAVLFFFLGGVAASAAVSGGWGSVAFWGLVVAAVCGAIGGFCGFMFFDMSYMEAMTPRTAAWICGAVFGLLTAYPAVHTIWNGHDTAVYMRETAPVVQQFARDHFSEIDADGNQLITEQELKDAAGRMRLTAQERAYIDFMISQQSELGHVIDSYTTTTFVWISTGNGGGYMSPIITTHYIYGINRGDIDVYPGKVVEKYKHW